MVKSIDVPLGIPYFRNSVKRYKKINKSTHRLEVINSKTKTVNGTMSCNIK